MLPVRIFVVICAFFCVAGAASAQAQSIDVVDGISFGQFVIKNNGSVYDAVTISAAGAQSENGMYIIPFFEGHPARVSLTGFDGNMPLTLIMNCGPLSSGLGGAVFSIVNPTYNPSSVVTSPTGTATIDIGATLRTNGSGSYPDDDYEGTCVFEANY